MAPSPRDRLIVALDFPTVAEAEAMASRLGATVTFYKVGLQLILTAGGMAFAERLAKTRRVFLDAKVLDIDNTVAGAVASIAAVGATFATIHAYPDAMRAAVAARAGLRRAEAASAAQAGSGLKLLAVTVLTSMNDADVAEAGYADTAADLVLRRAEQARAIGIDGIVASPAEAAAIRARVGAALTIVTPGIRPAGAASGDQKRLATPGAAIAAGADYLVIGRPITAARDPVAAADAIVTEIEEAAAAVPKRR